MLVNASQLRARARGSVRTCELAHRSTRSKERGLCVQGCIRAHLP